MKRLLVIAYHFPPIGGAGVQRTIKFVKYLPALGYEPVVLAGPGASWDATLGKDTTLAGELPSDLEILRLPAPEPPLASRWHARLERWLRLESAWRRWWIEGVIATGLKAGPVDAILATMSPFESAPAAAALASACGVPWIADLRDPWALDEMQVWPSALHRHLEMRRMRNLLRTPAAVVMNTPESALALRERFPALASRTHVVPNGFDAEDFEALPSERDDSAFRIVHAGFLHTAAGRRRRTRALHGLLGGATARVDYLTRSHVFLVDAVNRLRAERPDLGARLEVHLIGQRSEADLADSAPFLRFHGYLSHQETVDAIKSADLLFLPMHNLPAGRRARIVPGKTYEYLAADRPILAAVPDGDARDLLTEAASAFITRPDDSAGMAAAIARSMELRERGAAPRVDRQVIAPYERRALTERLAAVLDEVVVPQRTRRNQKLPGLARSGS